MMSTFYFILMNQLLFHHNKSFNLESMNFYTVYNHIYHQYLFLSLIFPQKDTHIVINLPLWQMKTISSHEQMLTI